MTQPTGKERFIYLRAWVGEQVQVVCQEKWNYSGILTNIVFDEGRLMYITLDDKTLLNFDHVVEISVVK